MRLGELNAVCKEEQAGGRAGGAGRLGFLSEGATLPTTTRQGKKAVFFLSLRSFIYLSDIISFYNKVIGLFAITNRRVNIHTHWHI